MVREHRLPWLSATKEIDMGVMDILKMYADRPTTTEDDFDEVARQVPPEVLGSGITEALESRQTPPFADMVQQLFGRSSPQLKSDLLGRLVRAAGPAVLAKIGGALGGAPTASADAAPALPDPDSVTPDQVREIAEEARRSNPGVLGQVSEIYAKHPETVKVLGGAALAIALGQMAKRMQR
jgi:hypothetical protein